ncbi:SNW/SKI-interacting protein [Zea mays]|jgi:SNW domain-containing protein 1|uniref:Pre-mRNA-splicing factor prp45 n=3 Tax=Zea mays TaxID=4577 RepID=B6UCY8_MAIZE|nr:pre-mRNA-splicing factor prp45 [Zea mays]ACG47221.1 pre-mRNA-splicing factor prp45 [Zea mays]AQK56404.1 Pre-mRNA-splicing factor prp45 [Zea mays]PWZ26640.1 SNW/SKI-interacting protein [Zea mays]|eukprot:NP_001152362.1 pre-mRNA-splicing factor prp45 [Zea mays]
MATLKDLLPAPKTSASTFYDHSSDPWFKERYGGESAQAAAATRPAAAARPVPPYGKRTGFVPRRPEDFGDGGAFPEIHVAQYPLGMGRRDDKGGSKILALTVDAHGSVAFDAVVKQGENAGKIVYSKHSDLVPKIATADSQATSDDDEEQKQIEETTERTKAALEKVVNVRLSAAQPKNVPTHDSESKFIKYKPSQQSAAFNSGAKERIIRMSEMAVDPLEPPKFKHKRVPRASGSPPVPVMHSPPRPVTVKDQQDWKIPPCISNWKNPKGYTIPLDKRLAADGRGLQEVQINDNFAKLSEALYVAEQKAREAVQMRSKVQRELMLKEKERKEQELRALAQRARMERTGAPPAPSGVPAGGGRGAIQDVDEVMDMEQPREPRESREQRRESREEREGRIERDRIREERRRERERERRLEAKDAAMGKKSKITRDRDRDISEKIALGMASTGGAKGGEVMYDQRLFNQDKGMDSGFATDDQYNIYSKGLFTAQSTMSTLYRPKKDGDSDVYGDADEQLEKVMKTERFKPDKGFTGASERTGKRDRPVEFDKQEENDPFGLDQFLTEVKKGKKAVEKIGGGGTMKASGGSSMRDDYDGGSGRSRINFERGR